MFDFPSSHIYSCINFAKSSTHEAKPLSNEYIYKVVGGLSIFRDEVREHKWHPFCHFHDHSYEDMEVDHLSDFHKVGVMELDPRVRAHHFPFEILLQGNSLENVVKLDSIKFQS